jgi:ribosomal-protein-alanine N-acetyltransferase
VLEHGDRVCGFIIFSSVLDEVCIHNLAVHPARQGEGFGRSLVVAALELAKQQGAGRCLLEVRESSTAARGLYETLSFQLDGIRKNYYPTPTGREDALLMSRQL